MNYFIITNEHGIKILVKGDVAAVRDGNVGIWKNGTDGPYGTLLHFVKNFREVFTFENVDQANEFKNNV